jgi:hypothetical protein
MLSPYSSPNGAYFDSCTATMIAHSSRIGGVIRVMGTMMQAIAIIPHERVYSRGGQIDISFGPFYVFVQPTGNFTRFLKIRFLQQKGHIVCIIQEGQGDVKTYLCGKNQKTGCE